MASPPVVLSHRELVDATTFERVSNRISKDYGFTSEASAEIFDAALGFLKLCATGDGPFAPSTLVDVGWHTFLLYTPEYWEFCSKVAGFFIHHVPNDGPDRTMGSHGVVRSENTVRYMRDHGIAFNPRVWDVPDEDQLPLCVAPCEAQPDGDDGTILMKDTCSDDYWNFKSRIPVIRMSGRNPNGCCDGGEGSACTGWDGSGY